MKNLRFEGNGFEYFKIWIVNILLVIVTLGIYYPWAKVRNNRYLYANTILEGRNFEYHATGKQLFLGYLVGVILLLIYVAMQSVSPILSAVMILAFVVAFPWIIWRSLKFNLRMTSFSNVRFSFENSVGGAYFNYMLLPFLLIMSVYLGPIIVFVALSSIFTSMGSLGTILSILIGITFLCLSFYIFALMKKRNVTYGIGGTRFGQGVFSTSLEVKPFILITLKTIGLSILAFIIYLFLIALIAMILGTGSELLSLTDSLNDRESLEAAIVGGGLIGILAAVYLGAIAISLLVSAYSYSRQRAYIYTNSSLDEKILFQSTVKARPLAGIMITNLLMVIFTLGLATPWAKVRMTRFLLENTRVDTTVGFDDYVTQKQEEQSALGEQIGDAFDVDIGVGF